MPSPNDMHPAYAAGLVDGEGCIIVRFGSKRRGRPYARSLLIAIEVTNTHWGVLSELQSAYGGSLYSKNYGKCHKATLEAWFLRFMGEDCHRLASEILPYSIVKRTQLEILLEAHMLLIRPGGTRMISAHQFRQREKVVARMASAKKDGTVLRAVA